MTRLVIQKWEESERGWGERPDGYSVHKSEEDRVQFIDEYWARMKVAYKGVPDEYERPCGKPYECEVSDISDEQFKLLEESSHGIRQYRVGDNNNRYPGSGGTDGWMQPESATEKSTS